MPLPKFLAFVGLCLDIAGVVLLLANEVLTRRRETAEDRLPVDFTTKHFEAELTGSAIRPNRPEEDFYERAAGMLPPRRALRWAVIGAILIIFGFVLQAVGLLVE
jgi:hypothetical protein